MEPFTVQTQGMLVPLVKSHIRFIMTPIKALDTVKPDTLDVIISIMNKFRDELIGGIVSSLKACSIKGV